ncbi:MAG: hypothetical protein JW908_00010 [Anaerolineales bacterium]|nr:hypothetical protein [Anaerolineales bacterium]
MVSKAKNISTGEQVIEMQMDSPYLVLIDLLVLDGISREFSLLTDPITSDPIEYLASLSGPLRIGLYEIPDFMPGNYRFSAGDLTIFDPDEISPEIVDIDTGEMVLIDYSHLGAVAKHLTWDLFDRYLQAPDNDDSIIVSINNKLGGAYFGILGADPETEFDGDGSYMMKPGAGVRLAG